MPETVLTTLFSPCEAWLLFSMLEAVSVSLQFDKDVCLHRVINMQWVFFSKQDAHSINLSLVQNFFLFDMLSSHFLLFYK